MNSMTLGASAEPRYDLTDTYPIPERTRWSYVTGIIPAEDLHSVWYDPGRTPRVGDVVLGQVVTIGRHTQIEYPTGRKARLFPGDYLGLVCGGRYATDQFEGYAPKALGPAHMLSVGGTCGEVLSRSANCPEPTLVDLLGYVHSPMGPINLRNYGLSPVAMAKHSAKVVLVTGNSMNSGKTTTAVHLIRGLVQHGFKVAAGKLTGTGCGNDPFQLVDAGAAPVLDFLSAGYESTFLASSEELIHIFRTVLTNLLAHSPDFVVLEVADGLLQRETATLLANPDLVGRVDYSIHCVADPLSVRGSVEILRRRGFNLIALSGMLSSRPLALKEVTTQTDLPVITVEQLAEGYVPGMIDEDLIEPSRAISAA
jgi:hypothetical protein